MLSKSEEWDFLRDMPVAFVVFRVLPSDIVYAYVNEAGARIEGFFREELAGKSMFEVFPEVDAATAEAVRMTAEQGVKQYFTRCIPGSRYLSIQTYQPRPGFCACVLHDVTDTARQDNLRKEEHQRLELQATRDPLTGLYNVREGRVLVERQLAEPRWKGTRGALFMFDLDDFKLVNDRFGHDRGDAVLKGFARVLERSFRCSDIVFRAGGDEFSSFVPDIPCACVAERICADVVASRETPQGEVRGREREHRRGPWGVPTHVLRIVLPARPSQALYGSQAHGQERYRIADMDDVRAEDVQGPTPTTLPAA